MAKRGKSGRKLGKRTQKNGNTMRRRGGADSSDPSLHKLKGMMGGADFDPSILAKKMQGGKRRGSKRCRSTKRR